MPNCPSAVSAPRQILLFLMRRAELTARIERRRSLAILAVDNSGRRRGGSDMKDAPWFAFLGRGLRPVRHPLGCHTGAFAPNCGEVLVFADVYAGIFIW